ncbi:MAG: hypothetical protein FWF59_03250 [Turicibacter sp.]|nr:hypothetical protein [Turicibacter sp.]
MGEELKKAGFLVSYQGFGTFSTTDSFFQESSNKMIVDWYPLLNEDIKYKYDSYVESHVKYEEQSQLKATKEQEEFKYSWEVNQIDGIDFDYDGND